MDAVNRGDEELLLDLLNTTPVVDGKRTDELADAKSAVVWTAAHGGTGRATEVASLRRIRDAIQPVLDGTSAPETLAVHFEEIALTPRLRDGVIVWELLTDGDKTLAARTLLAWTAINERAPGRLRPCANPECCRFLHDRSNANTARWCSMALCGNRAKARRHYQRTRASTE